MSIMISELYGKGVLSNSGNMAEICDKEKVIIMAYICMHCGKEVKSIDKFVRCPYCGYRVLAKKRSTIVREVSTD